MLVCGAVLAASLVLLGRSRRRGRSGAPRRGLAATVVEFGLCVFSVACAAQFLQLRALAGGSSNISAWSGSAAASELHLASYLHSLYSASESGGAATLTASPSASPPPPPPLPAALAQEAAARWQRVALTLEQELAVARRELAAMAGTLAEARAATAGAAAVAAPPVLPVLPQKLPPPLPTTTVAATTTATAMTTTPLVPQSPLLPPPPPGVPTFPVPASVAGATAAVLAITRDDAAFLPEALATVRGIMAPFKAYVGDVLCAVVHKPLGTLSKTARVLPGTTLSSSRMTPPTGPRRCYGSGPRPTHASSSSLSTSARLPAAAAAGAAAGKAAGSGRWWEKSRRSVSWRRCVTAASSWRTC